MVTYEKAIITLQAYFDWRNSNCNGIGKHMMPDQDDLDESLLQAIRTLRDITHDKIPTSPAELRFNAIGEMIQRFIECNKDYESHL